VTDSARRPDPSSPSRATLFAAAGLVVATVAAYANSFGSPFVFDDVPTIVENTSIRQLWPLGKVLLPDVEGGLTTSGRPLVNLSLALNYALSGKAVWSYHLVNLAIHVAAGLALFGAMRRTLLLPRLRERFGGGAVPLAFFVAALWTLHPLQTESVTYVVQRAESLAGLFCLLTFYCFIRGVEPDGTRGWRAGTVICCALGMATKEVMVGVPLLVLLYDRTFLSGGWREAWRARWRLWLALGATWLLLILLMAGTGGRGGTAGFGVGVSSWHYALTQCRAIITYLGLSVWPQGLVFDYGLDVQGSLIAVLPQACLLVGLLATGAMLVVRGAAAGFLAAWFFVLLAPTSSFVPIVTQSAAEHRMYLPLVAVVALVVLGTHRWLAGRAVWIWLAPLVALGAATVVRNTDYRSESAIWRDAADKLPSNARAHNNLGQALYREGRVPEAMRRYEEALRLRPNYPETHYNLATALAATGQLPAAVSHYETALRLQPNYPAAQNNLGNALVKLGRVDEAVKHYEIALRLDPTFAEPYGNLGNALLQAGRAEESLTHFRRALELQPGSAEGRYNLGNALASLNRMPEALQQYRDALQLKPDYVEARVNAGNALLQLGRGGEAIAEYEKAVAGSPSHADARFNLASALLDAGRWAEAIPHLERAVQLRPEWAEAHRALGFALVKAGRAAEAVAHYEFCVRAAPGDAALKQELAEVRAMLGRGGR
jgi:tetratricopeptide (TPR) repeat protein